MRYPEIRESSEVSMEQYVSLAHSLSFLHRRPATTEVRGVGHESRRNNFCGNPLCDTWADSQPTERARLPPACLSGGQFNCFVEISTDFSTALVLQGVPHYYKNSVEKSAEKSVEISTKLLN